MVKRGDFLRTLYVSDLDGTLLGRDGKLSAYTARTLQALTRRGMCFSYATARSLSSAQKVMGGIALPGPVIVYNGTFIRRTDGEILEARYFEADTAAFLRGTMAAMGLSPVVYAYIGARECVSYLAGAANPAVREYLAARPGDKRFRPVQGEDALYEGRSFYMTCMGERQQVYPLYAALEGHKGVRVTFQRELGSRYYWCEMMSPEATKAAAARTLSRMLGCGRIVAFGDAVNDIPLLEAADEGYAVGNAVPELKRVARGVIGANDEDGPARFMAQDFLARLENRA